MRLCNYVDQYVLENDLRPKSIESYRVAARMLENFAGGVEVEELSDDLVNRWLAHLAELGRSKYTIASRRRHLLVLWRAAFNDGLVKAWPRKVRVIRCPATTRDIWTVDEMKQLVQAAKDLPGTYKNGISRSTYFETLIRAAWESGLRQCDLFDLPCAHWGQRVFDIVQIKTGNAVRVRFREDTFGAIADFIAQTPREKIWPLCVRRRKFFLEMRELISTAGLVGTFKKIRRSSITWVEQQQTGLGYLHAGHTNSSTAARWYVNPAIAYDDKMPTLPDIDY